MPSKDDLGKKGPRKWLHELCIKYVEMYLMTGSEVEPLVQQVHELESAIGSNVFLCRIEGCDKTYVHHSSRVCEIYRDYSNVQTRGNSFYHYTVHCNIKTYTKRNLARIN